MARRAITGACRPTLTVAMEVMLNLTPLHILIETESIVVLPPTIDYTFYSDGSQNGMWSMNAGRH